MTISTTKDQEQKHRLTVTLPHYIYSELEHRSSLQDVSIAWLIRKALSQYISSDIPLLTSHEEKE